MRPLPNADLNLDLTSNSRAQQDGRGNGGRNSGSGNDDWAFGGWGSQHTDDPPF